MYSFIKDFKNNYDSLRNIPNSTIRSIVLNLSMMLIRGSEKSIQTRVPPSFINSYAYQTFKNELIDMGFRVKETNMRSRMGGSEVFCVISL